MGSIIGWQSALDHIADAAKTAEALIKSKIPGGGANVGKRPPNAMDAPSRATPAEEGEFAIGSFDDRVTLEIDGHEVLIAEGYDVDVGVFSQPAAFAITLGHSGLVKELLAMTTPHKPFKLKIGDTLVQTGYIDGHAAGGQNATVQVKGRDTLQDIHDSYCGVERTFSEKGYVAFVKAVLEHAQYPSEKLQLTDDAMRRAMSAGHPLPFPAVPEEREIKGTVKMRLGDRVFDFLKRVLDRAGLFLYASPGGQLLLTAPKQESEPLYKLVHVPTDEIKHGNCIDYGFEFNTADRVSAYVVYARGGGKKLGIVKYQAGHPDDEMVELGYKRTHTFRDWHVQSDAQANLMARRKIAEARRRSWQLHVVVAGHTTNALDSRETLVWRPDTMVRFQSDQLGLDDVYYIENVRYARGAGGTTTNLRLMRRGDLLFGYEPTDDEGGGGAAAAPAPEPEEPEPAPIGRPA